MVDLYSLRRGHVEELAYKETKYNHQPCVPCSSSLSESSPKARLMLPRCTPVLNRFGVVLFFTAPSFMLTDIGFFALP